MPRVTALEDARARRRRVAIACACAVALGVALDAAWRRERGRNERRQRATWSEWAKRVALSIAIPLRSAARDRWFAVMGSAPARDGFADPSLPIYVIGATSAKRLEGRLGKELWAWFVDALGVSKTSAGRAHLEGVLQSEETRRELDALFDELVTRYPRTGSAEDEASGATGSAPSEPSISAEGLIAFSDGIRGSIRQVMDRSTKVDIKPASAAEHAFLRDNFGLLFPTSDPLDREAFRALAKLILVRRIIKAIVGEFGGLAVIQRGLAEPLVCDVRCFVGKECVFHVHTVAPKSDAVEHTGRRLGVISEN